jgi:hypothetical protein
VTERSSSSSSSSGIGFGGLLTIVFITLKLTGYIDWSWWWVTCPLWAPIVFLLAIAIIGLLFIGGAAGVAAIVDWQINRK